MKDACIEEEGSDCDAAFLQKIFVTVNVEVGDRQSKENKANDDR